MKLGKRIAALGAAVVMIMSVSAVGASAVEYCSGRTKSKSWLTKNGGAFYKDVETIYYGNRELGTIKATYTKGCGVKCTDYGQSCRTHYARVGSNGKYKEAKPVKAAFPSETGYVSLKNNARFEGWYKY